MAETLGARLGLPPWDFWRLTLRELNLYARAHGMKEQNEWRRTAWLAANVINLFVKEPLTADDLLNPRSPMTEQDREGAFQELWRRREHEREAG